MFLLVSVRHVGAHPVGHQHGMSIQISINLGKTFLRISRIQNIPLTWILASNLVYLPPFRCFPDSRLYLLNVFDFYFMIYFECRDTENQLFGIVWIAIARGGTSRSHTLKILPARLAERDWCTKFQSSLLKIYSRLSGFQASFLLIYFRDVPNITLRQNMAQNLSDMWHSTQSTVLVFEQKPYPVWFSWRQKSYTE